MTDSTTIAHRIREAVPLDWQLRGSRCDYCEADCAIFFPGAPVCAQLCYGCGMVEKFDPRAKTREKLRPPETDEFMEARHRLLLAHMVITHALAEHDPSTVVGCMSGGHDSLVATHVTMLHPAADSVLHINTGIGIQETRDFVRETCAFFGWPLDEYKATDNEKADGTPDPQIYEELVVPPEVEAGEVPPEEKGGFPGPPMHWKMYSRLKERQIERFVRDHKEGRGDRIAFCTGVRSDESARRKMGYKDPVDRNGAQLWVNPILDWSGSQCTDYINNFVLPQNRVVELLCMSGECLCGAFAKDGEMEMLEACFPDVADRLHRLEERATEAGYVWGWEERPPAWWVEWSRGQQFLPGVAPEAAEEADRQPMCTSCHFKHEQAERLAGGAG